MKRFSIKLNKRFDDCYPEWGIYCNGRRIALMSRSAFSDEIMLNFVDADFDFCTVYFHPFTQAYELKALLKAIATTV